MKLINSECALRTFLPNVIAEVKGETPLFDKLVPHLETAEAWLEQHIIDAALLAEVAKRDRGDALRDRLSEVVAAAALRDAIPSLDLVYTPNGFAVTQTQNLAPASAPRVERLIASVKAHRDCALHLALDLLPALEGWCDTPQARYFARSLFPNIDLAQYVPNPDTSPDQWEVFERLVPAAADIEDSLAAEFFSPELMEVWRDRSLRRSLSPADKTVVYRLRHVVIERMQNHHVGRDRLTDMVDYIRRHETDFPEWHASATARLFSPPVFTNKKNSGGYFF